MIVSDMLRTHTYGSILNSIFLKNTFEQSFILPVWYFWSHSRGYHIYGDVTIADAGLHILTYARHSLVLSSDVFVACHTYSGIAYPFIMIIFEKPSHSLLL